MACVAVGATCGLWENAWPWYCLVDYLCATGLRPTQCHRHFGVAFKPGTNLPVATGPCRAYQQPSGLGGANPPPCCRTLSLKENLAKHAERARRATVPGDNLGAKKQRRVRRARRVQGTMGGKGGHRGHAERQSQVPTVALTLKTQNRTKTTPEMDSATPKTPRANTSPRRTRGTRDGPKSRRQRNMEGQPASMVCMNS